MRLITLLCSLATLFIVFLVLAIRYLIRRIRRFKKTLSYILLANKKLTTLSYKTERIEEALHNATIEIKRENNLLNYEWTNISTSICHAMGKVDGHIFTNSKEAFLENYKKGYRIFEVDIALTKDMVPVLVHSWYQYNGGDFIFDWKKVYREGDPNIPTFTEFKQMRIGGKYSGLSLYELVILAKDYSDAYFIVSIKTERFEYDHYAKFLFSTLDLIIKCVDQTLFHRIIPQVHGVHYINAVLKNFNFESIIYGTRPEQDFEAGDSELVKILSDKGILAVSCSQSTITKELCALYHQHNIKVLAYAIENKKQEGMLRSLGVDLIIGDYEL
jgi:glycerophosphoryl diester phosphodiesterase